MPDQADILDRPIASLESLAEAINLGQCVAGVEVGVRDVEGDVVDRPGRVVRYDEDREVVDEPNRLVVVEVAQRAGRRVLRV